MTSLYKGKNDVISSGRARTIHLRIAQDDDLDGVDFRVLHYFLAKLDAKKPTAIPQTEIAEELGKQTTHVSRSIRKLKDKGILIAGDRVGRSVEFRFNPDYGKE